MWPMPRTPFRAATMPLPSTAYNTIARLEPGNPEPWITMSRLHMIEQDIKAAFDTATEAVKLDEKNPAALAALARAEDWQGELRERPQPCP